MSQTLTGRIESVHQKIQEAAKRARRDVSDIRLVAVSKKFSADVIREAYYSGLREFGENYVQEFVGKYPALADLSDARFHMIGHLQSNKAGIAAELFHSVQTVDSSKLLKRLNDARAGAATPLEVLLEIKLSDEDSKSGMTPDGIGPLLRASRELEHVRVTGLMVIPPWTEEAEQSRPYFRRLAELARQHGLLSLSMGMSNDFEVAIEEGATIVRVGTAIFGARPKPNTAQ